MNEALSKFRDETLDLYYQIRDDEIDWDVANATIVRLNEALDEMPNIMAASYKSIWGTT